VRKTKKKSKHDSLVPSEVSTSIEKFTRNETRKKDEI
jgi:hypothetical protein